MKFTETSVTTQKEILKRKLGGELFEEITLLTVRHLQMEFAKPEIQLMKMVKR